MNPHLMSKLVPIVIESLAEKAANFSETAAEVLKARIVRPLNPLEVFAQMAHLQKMVEMVVAADAAQVLLKQAYDALGEAIARSSPYNPEHPTTTIQIPGLPGLTPRWPKDRKAWKNDVLRDDVLRQARGVAMEKPAAVDPETGEPTPSFDQAVEVIEGVVSFIGSNMKSRGLKALGLDPDEYAEVVKGVPTVQVVR